MALMLGKLYDALIAGGTPPDKAREAAEEVAGCENRPAAIENRLARVEARLAVLQWLTGASLALQLTTLGLVFNLISRLPAS